MRSNSTILAHCLSLPRRQTDPTACRRRTGAKMAQDLPINLRTAFPKPMVLITLIRYNMKRDISCHLNDFLWLVKGCVSLYLLSKYFFCILRLQVLHLSRLIKLFHLIVWTRSWVRSQGKMLNNHSFAFFLLKTMSGFLICIDDQIYIFLFLPFIQQLQSTKYRPSTSFLTSKQNE